MRRFCGSLVVLLIALIVLLGNSVRAALIPRLDLNSLCYLSTDIVEVTVVRHHTLGQEEWKDTFTAIVTNSLEGKHKAGDQLEPLGLELYSPAQTGQHSILFLAPAGFPFRNQPVKSAPLQVVDMLLVDNHNSVHRYFQQNNPGGLQADEYFPHRIYPTLAQERIAVVSAWVAAKKLKASPSQVLNPYQVLR